MASNYIFLTSRLRCGDDPLRRRNKILQKRSFKMTFIGCHRAQAEWISLFILCGFMLTSSAAAETSDKNPKQRARQGKHWCLVSSSDILRLNMLTRREPLQCERKIVSDKRISYREFLKRQWKCRSLGSAGKTSCMVLRSLPVVTQFLFILVVPSCISMISLSVLIILRKLNEIQALDKELTGVS